MAPPGIYSTSASLSGSVALLVDASIISQSQPFMVTTVLPTTTTLTSATHTESVTDDFTINKDNLSILSPQFSAVQSTSNASPVISIVACTEVSTIDNTGFKDGSSSLSIPSMPPNPSSSSPVMYLETTNKSNSILLDLMNSLSNILKVINSEDTISLNDQGPSPSFHSTPKRSQMKRSSTSMCYPLAPPTGVFPMLASSTVQQQVCLSAPTDSNEAMKDGSLGRTKLVLVTFQKRGG